MTAAPTPREVAAGFHDAECAGYRADLPYWQELAARVGGPILDLGAGTGRVTLPLAADGHELIAVDIDPLLLEELEHRAAALGLSPRTLTADITRLDAAALDLPGSAALALIPMQTIQLLAGGDARRRALRAIAAACAPGATLAIAIVPRVDPFDGRGASPRLLPPDLARVGDWRFESTPLAVLQASGAEPIDMHRRRRIRSAAGEAIDAADDVVITLQPLPVAVLEDEAEGCGWTPAGCTEFPATDEHTGGWVVEFTRDATAAGAPA